jgi:hypothetical protein
MNKQEVIDKFVCGYRGEVPTSDQCKIDDAVGVYTLHSGRVSGFTSGGHRILALEFQQRAKELGFVGRYRWGVEYKTDGKQPGLDDDVVVQCVLINRGLRDSGRSCPVVYWDWIKLGNDSDVQSFKITDQRYKPIDTSYLDKPDSSLDNGADWYCYETQKALRLPPVGEKVEAFMHWTGGWSVGWVLVVGHDADGVIWRNGSDTKSYIHSPRCEIRPLDHDRKAKAERKKVVDAAIKAMHPNPLTGTMAKWFETLYDKGFLRLPD